MIRIWNAYITTTAFVYVLWEALLVAGAFALATYQLIDLDPADYLLHDYGAVAILVVTASFVAGLYFQDLYSEFHVQSKVLLLQQLCIVSGMAFLIQGLISYLSSSLRMPVRIMIVGSILAMGGIFVGRLLMSNYAIQRIPKATLLLVGGSPIFDDLHRYIQERPQTGMQVAGYVDEAPAAGEGPKRKSFGSLNHLRDIVQKLRPTHIILGLESPPAPALSDELLEIRYAGYDIQTAAATYERVSSRVSIFSLDPERLICDGVWNASARSLFYRGLFNRGVALALLIPALPFLFSIGVVLLALEGRPVVIGRLLMGQEGRQFRQYRFRTNPSSRFARFLRRAWLDALPQLVNVLKGEMFFAGPRAEPPEYVQVLSQYIPYYKERYRVPPGLTGWEQIHWTDLGTLPDTIGKLEYDMYYLKNMSWTLDTLILLHTFKVLFTAI